MLFQINLLMSPVVTISICCSKHVAFYNPDPVLLLGLHLNSLCICYMQLIKVSILGPGLNFLFVLPGL